MALGGVIVLDDVVTYLGDPDTQARAVATINAMGRVTGFTILAGGSGYNTAPSVTLSGGGGSGATATATVTRGAVTGISVSNAGSSYERPPRVFIRNVSRGTDISATVVSARLHFIHTSIEVPHTHGRNHGITKTSKKYRWMVDLEFQTDGFSSAGGVTIDELMTKYLPAPLEHDRSDHVGTGACRLTLYPVGTARTNRFYTGDVSLSEWEPLGTGSTEDIISQTRTFAGLRECDVLTVP